MANECEYDMLVVGPLKSVRLFGDMLDRQYVDDDGIHQVFYKTCGYERGEICALDDGAIENDDTPVSVHVFGSIGWAAEHFLDEDDTIEVTEDGTKYHRTNLQTVSEKFDLAFEIYSSEPGCQFQEHIIVSWGAVRVKEACTYIDNCIEAGFLPDHGESEHGNIAWLTVSMYDMYKDILVKETTIPESQREEYLMAFCEDLCHLAKRFAESNGTLTADYIMGGYDEEYLYPESLWDGATQYATVSAEFHYNI